jgi:hypothetical protein
MTFMPDLRRVAGAALVGCLALALSGCLLSPGKFTSQLTLHKDGAFSYVYDGQIYLLALSKLADMGAKADSGDDAFVQQPCYNDDTFEERDCTAAEIAEQKKTWEEGHEARRKEAAKNAEMMRAMLGGIDPADPDAAQELAARMERQAGWKKVTYQGDGMFDVSFESAGRLDHDFLFPTIESFPMSNFFVLVGLRDGNTVRVDAPGFAPQTGGNPFAGMMSGMAGAMAAEKAGEDDAAADAAMFPDLDGTFTIVTDGEILANNTDEGPVDSAQGHTLAWKVTKRTKAAPTALIRIAP